MLSMNNFTRVLFCFSPCSSGVYRGFDKTAPTSRDGGKPAVVTALKAERGLTPITMIGDGVTDMQARPPADAFIGFGGIVARPPVQKGADLFVVSFHDLLRELERGH